MSNPKKVLPIALLCMSLSWTSHAENKVDCASTADCQKLAAHIGTSTGIPPGPATSAHDKAEDQFYWLNKINKASVVMLLEENILAKDKARKIAGGIDLTIRQAETPGGKRPSDVLQIEKIITDYIGPDASLVHTGRSRQDMYATFRMAQLRNQMLDFHEQLNALRGSILQLARQNQTTIVPAYTNGVQAMPTSLAHYLLAYEASFERDAQRMMELYARMNRSAMGSAVLANSSWPLNRERMAELLGFDGIIENSLDAGQISPSDVSLEAMALLSSTAIRLGALLSDIHTQYHQTQPWMLLDEGQTYTSSAMPQKRNPGIIMRARESASNVVGLAQTVVFRAHNVSTGMADYKNPWSELGVIAQAVNMLKNTTRVVGALHIDADRSLSELENDWTTSMELAEELQRDHAVPFRVGHSFASLIVSYAREHGQRPRDFPFEVAERLYGEALGKHGLPVAALPLTNAQLQDVLSPRKMVNSRKGTGGPQPAEVRRMLEKAQKNLDDSRQWLDVKRANLRNADIQLDARFATLAGQ